MQAPHDTPGPSAPHTAYVVFANHFDLVWRRGWERAYCYEGGRWASYAEVETAVLDAALALAEAGRGAYQVEQALTLRMYLRARPHVLPLLQRLYREGCFEVLGAGEAIIDVNMCTFETMARNLASGTRFCRDVLGMPPSLATHNDGFGSSGQFPQVIRGCGYRAVQGLSYSRPQGDFWRGLDGSTVYVCHGWPGRSLFYDHCYHEPCPACRGESCPDCRGTGLDLAQNFYPPFPPLETADFRRGLALYTVCSEEMLPPDYLDEVLREWEQQYPQILYRWGTERHLLPLLAEDLALADDPPAARLSPHVENNPVQTGCYVSRILVKQGAARCEGAYYAAETALAAALFAGALPPDTVAAWHELFLELPLFYFHDAVTGTHQDEAAAELLDRISAHEARIAEFSAAALTGDATASAPAAPDRTVRVFNPRAESAAPLRIPLPVLDWRNAAPLVAESPDGRRFPVTLPWHGFSPPVPLAEGRLINAVGSGTRVRPRAGEAFLEASDLPPQAWTELRLRQAAPPSPLQGRELTSDRFRVTLGEQGVEQIADRHTGAVAHAEPEFPLGSLRLEEDEGDPWGTRKPPAFQCPLAPFTRFLGAAVFEGYSEAWYAGLFEPNLRFGREEDPLVFALEWQATVRLLEDAERVDFHYELFWKCASRRVRAVFPLQAASDTAWYGIPGGWLRRPRYEQTETCLWSPNGDWPAHRFVAAAPPEGAPAGWAVTHYGTPSARVEEGRLLLSLLRSPTFGHCLERYAQTYPMPTSGVRDPGWHHFTLSLLPHRGEGDLPRLTRAAAALNARPLALSATAAPPDATWPRLSSETVELVACKPLFLPAPAGVPAHAVVLRLLNQSPAESRATLTAPASAPVRLQECDLLEQPSSEAQDLPAGDSVEVPFGPFQARSFLVWRVGTR